MKINPKSPPLTIDDIVTLRGKPVAKRIKELKNSALLALEQWICYNLKTKEQEYFLFKNGSLMNWQKKPF